MTLIKKYRVRWKDRTIYSSTKQGITFLESNGSFVTTGVIVYLCDHYLFKIKKELQSEVFYDTSIWLLFHGLVDTQRDNYFKLKLEDIDTCLGMKMNLKWLIQYPWYFMICLSTER